MLPCLLIVRVHLRPTSAPLHLRVLSDLCVEIPPSRGSRYRTSSKFPRNPAKKAPFKSALCALFKVPYPLSSLPATLTNTAGCAPTIPILELIPPPRIHLSFQSVAQCPFCNPFVLMVFHLMGVCVPPPAFDVRTYGRSTYYRPIHRVFTLLRTLLRTAKAQLFSFQAIPHSLPKTTRGGGRGSALCRILSLT